MHYIADLHVHSHYSRATSKNLNLESLYQWANIKGIHVVGTGDFTHPKWFKELKEKLIPDDETGFYRLKNPPQETAMPGLKHQAIDVRFCLTTEISSIYKYDNKVRKNHNLLYARDLDTVASINQKLATIGNLNADGRPILGLSARNLLEIILDISDNAYLIPAHIWTPWFSTLGAKSGYDSIDDCFRDLAAHIFAFETGLSSDPMMNWRVSALDRYTMISNSDAHSPQKLGREANLFDTDMTYDAMFQAIKTRKGFLGTLEFFPEEGKYYMDGHRACGVCIDPIISQRYKGLCPVCAKPVTMGVLHRVEVLANRKQSIPPPEASNFEYIIPLPEIIAEINKRGPNTKTVQKIYCQIIAQFGNEFDFLRKVPIEDIQKYTNLVYAEAIRRLRKQLVKPIPGYDGIFGTIQLFKEGEVDALLGQRNYFQKNHTTEKKYVPQQYTLESIHDAQKKDVLQQKKLNDIQKNITHTIHGAVLVHAGPGTGKTHTLVQWIIQVIKQASTSIKLLAITFTNKAANEMKERIVHELDNRSDMPIEIGTFHGIGYQMLQERYSIDTIYGKEERKIIIQHLWPSSTKSLQKSIDNAFSAYFELGKTSDLENFSQYLTTYQCYLQEHKAVDLAGIINQVLILWKTEPMWLQIHQNKYQYIAVDELQDINPVQYQWICQLAKNKNILCIGDPDQAIYGFRGADMRLFFQFEKDFYAKKYNLIHNYRNTKPILEAATSMIQYDTDHIHLPLTAHTMQGKKINLVQTNNEYVEAQYIVNQIKHYIGGIDNLARGEHDEGNFALEDIAVLFRTKAIGKIIFQQLHAAGIPVVFSDGVTIFEKTPFSIIADIIKLYIQPTDKIAFWRFLTTGLQWKSTMVQKFMHTIASHSNTFPLFPPSFLPEEAKNNYQQWIIFYQSLSKINEQNGVEGIVNSIITQYFPAIHEDKNYDNQKIALLALAKASRKDINHFFKKNILNHYTEGNSLQAQGVHLLTFHAAKGLEFPIVFIAAAEENIVPLVQNSSIEEERRLLYVALTRAKQHVTITYTTTRLYFHQRKQCVLSRFIKEISNKLIKKINITSQKTSKQLKFL